jgi:multicomponent Na+:H+ antiporter subunit D
LTGSIFYIIHHIIVKTNLFLVSGIAEKIGGSFELEELGGLSRTAPGLTVVFAISAFSLAGIPPLSGFWAKLILIQSSLELKSYMIAATALGVSLLTLFSMTKIWAGAFWKEPAGQNDTAAINVFVRNPPISGLPLYMPLVALALLTVTIGLMSEPVFALAGRAAEQLLNPRAYISTVLQGRP